MIPNIIHYCWYGGAEKPEIILQCIASWREQNPTFQIKEWNETNSPKHHIVSKNIKNKLWAYASDYTRLYALYEYGGFYLDTDILLVKPLTSLFKYQCFIAFQYTDNDKYWLNNSVCGAIPKHDFFKNSLKMLSKRGHSKTNAYISPELTSDVMRSYVSNLKYGTQLINDIMLLDKDYFYFHGYEIARSNTTARLIELLPEKSVGIHLFNHSWKTTSSQYSIADKFKLFLKKIKLKLAYEYKKRI